MTQPPEKKRPPSALELAWGVQSGGRRGPKPARSLAEILDAAVAIADAEGIDALSMQRLAAELGFTTMALYRYVASKDDLVMLAVDAVGADVPDVPAPGEDWRSGLERWARAQEQLFVRHPWIARVPITGPPAAPNQVAWMERALRCLAATPLSMAERVGVLSLLAGFVLNHRRLYDDMARASSAEGRSLEDSGRDYAELLGQLIDPTRFPNVAAAFAEGGSEPGADDARDEFEFGLARILDGVAHLVERRQRAV
jgi:AcrR family transcriptional regulator